MPLGLDTYSVAFLLFSSRSGSLVLSQWCSFGLTVVRLDPPDPVTESRSVLYQYDLGFFVYLGSVSLFLNPPVPRSTKSKKQTDSVSF